MSMFDLFLSLPTNWGKIFLLSLLTAIRIVVDQVHLDLDLVEKWYNTYVRNTNTMCARDYQMTLFAVHNQEIAQVSPDPFPRERVGSGDETMLMSSIW